MASGQRDGSNFSCMQKLQMGISSFISSRPNEHPWSTYVSDSSGRWDSLSFPVLEMFFFRRVIFDELHELQGGAKGDAAGADAF